MTNTQSAEHSNPQSGPLLDPSLYFMRRLQIFIIKVMLGNSNQGWFTYSRVLVFESQKSKQCLVLKFVIVCERRKSKTVPGS